MKIFYSHHHFSLKNFTMVKLSQAIRHLMFLLIYSQFEHKISSTKAQSSHSTLYNIYNIVHLSSKAKKQCRWRCRRLNLLKLFWVATQRRASTYTRILLIMKQFILNKNNNNRNFLQIVLFFVRWYYYNLEGVERFEADKTRHRHHPTQFYCWKFSLKCTSWEPT
jgi:hypothetical protein